MTLKPIKNDTLGKGYCGPTAIAAITGKKLSVVLDTIREIWWPDKWWRKRSERRPPVRGVGHNALRNALSKLGYRSFEETFHKPMTIEKLIKERRITTTYGIAVTKPILGSKRGHYVAIAGQKVLDTSTEGKPIPVSEFKGRADPVTALISVAKGGWNTVKSKS